MRQNGQFTFESPAGVVQVAVTGDNLPTAGFLRIFTAYERLTVVEVGVIATGAAAPGAAFTFRVKKRPGGVPANDIIIPVWKSQFAAEGGPGGDPSVQNFDNANAIANGLITNTAGLLVQGKALRAYTEITLDKGDQLAFEVVGAGAATSTGVFYAKAYPGGAGIVESNDVESN
jgi:hypothetical protein